MALRARTSTSVRLAQLTVKKIKHDYDDNSQTKAFMLAGRAPATLARSYEKRVWPHGFVSNQGSHG